MLSQPSASLRRTQREERTWGSSPRTCPRRCSLTALRLWSTTSDPSSRTRSEYRHKGSQLCGTASVRLPESGEGRTVFGDELPHEDDELLVHSVVDQTDDWRRSLLDVRRHVPAPASVSSCSASGRKRSHVHHSAHNLALAHVRPRDIATAKATTFLGRVKVEFERVDRRNERLAKERGEERDQSRRPRAIVVCRYRQEGQGSESDGKGTYQLRERGGTGAG